MFVSMQLSYVSQTNTTTVSFVICAALANYKLCIRVLILKNYSQHQNHGRNRLTCVINVCAMIEPQFKFVVFCREVVNKYHYTTVALLRNITRTTFPLL